MEQPSITNVNLTSDQLNFTNKILSSEALACQIVDRIKKHIPTSVVRMSDGERGFINHYMGGPKEWFMNTPEWVKRYGLEGADFKETGRCLLEAGKKADYLACPIAGLYWPSFNTYSMFPERTQFIDQFFPLFFEAAGHAGEILNMGKVVVLHREYQGVVDALKRKYGLGKGVSGIRLDSWRDHEAVMASVNDHNPDIILVSGGPSGKPLCVDLAHHTGAVVLDCGEALGSLWVEPKKNLMQLHEENKERI